MKLKILFLLFFICNLVQAETPVVQWAKSFGGTSFDDPTASAFDSKGNMYVVGYLWSPTVQIGTAVFHYTGEYTIGTSFVVKYDHLGNVLWAKGIEGVSSANGIAIDKSDNVYVCGVFYDDSITFAKQKFYNDYKYAGKLLLFKYDSSGIELWAKSCVNADKYSNQGSSYGSICIDKAENIFVVGGFHGGIKIENTVLINQSAWGTLLISKYKSNGDLIWAKSIVNKGTGSIGSSGIAVDLQSNIFITGSFMGKNTFFNDSLNVTPNSTQDIYISKLDSAGNPLWVRHPQGKGDDVVETIAGDKSGNVYIGGHFGHNTGYGIRDLCPITFDSITLAASSEYYNLFLAKYNPTGKVLWAKTVPKVEKSHEGIFSICVDNKNNVYSTGFFNASSITFDSITLVNKGSVTAEIFINKSDSLGNTLWAKSFGGGDIGESGSTISTDNSGNLLLTGYTESSDLGIGTNTVSSSGKTDVLVVKLILDSTHNYITSKYCSNDSILTLSAPANNSLYTWIDSNNNLLSNSQSLTIKTPIDSAVYTCKFNNSVDSTIVNIYTLQKYDSKADFSSSLSDCTTNTVQFTNQSTTNRGSLTYLWDFGDGTTSTEINPLHKYNTVGTHQVSLSVTTTPTTCTNSTSKTITYYPKPTIKIEGDSTLCHGVPVTLKAQGAASYKWSTGSTDESIQVATTQKVWLLGYSASGCVSDTAFLRVTDRTPVVSINGKATYCPGLSVTLKARGASSYKWSTGSIADSINVSSPGTIWVVGYTSTCVSDTVKYSVSEEPDFNVSINGNMYICSGESTTLTAAGATSYRWSTGEKTNSITLTKAGGYSVIGSNARGCERELSFNVTEEKLPALDFTVSSSTIDSRHNKLTCKTTATAGIEYSWNMGDGSTEHGPETEHTYNIPNSVNTYTITLTATNAWGCSNNLSKEIDVILFIPNVFSPNGDGVNDVFMPDVNLEVQDRNGVTLFKGTSGWDGNYRLKKMPDDTYYYVVTYKDKNGQTQMQKGYVILKR